MTSHIIPDEMVSQEQSDHLNLMIDEMEIITKKANTDVVLPSQVTRYPVIRSEIISDQNIINYSFKINNAVQLNLVFYAQSSSYSQWKYVGSCDFSTLSDYFFYAHARANNNANPVLCKINKDGGLYYLSDQYVSNADHVIVYTIIR